MTRYINGILTYCPRKPSFRDTIYFEMKLKNQKGNATTHTRFTFDCYVHFKYHWKYMIFLGNNALQDYES